MSVLGANALSFQARNLIINKKRKLLVILFVKIVKVLICFVKGTVPIHSLFIRTSKIEVQAGCF